MYSSNEAYFFAHTISKRAHRPIFLSQNVSLRWVINEENQDFGRCVASTNRVGKLLGN